MPGTFLVTFPVRFLCGIGAVSGFAAIFLTAKSLCSLVRKENAASRACGENTHQYKKAWYIYFELWTDIKWVRFHRTEVLSSVSDAEFGDLSFGKGPRLLGSYPDRRKLKKLFEKHEFSSF